MLYDIGVRITYSYDYPTDAGRHLLRLMPADLPGEQRVIVGVLTPTPRPEERTDRLDFFGNGTTEVGYRSAHEKIEFRVEARVERLATPPRLDMSPPLSGMPRELSEIRDLSPWAPHHFLGASPRVPIDPDITAFAHALADRNKTVREIAESVGRQLHQEMRFDAGATTVDTPPTEAFQRRHGVCQDFTHIMISALRGIGIPAAYTSGFLRTIPPEGQQRLEGADAMHAWVRVWCGQETGWVEYDPTNALVVGQDHIVVARGRDYSDVSPVKGVLRTYGEQSSEQAVDVVPLDSVPA